MAVNLTSGAILKIWTGECTSNDLKPVVQVKFSDGLVRNISGKQWHVVMLSDGSFVLLGCIPVEIYISNKLQIGSVVQLTDFELGKFCDSNGEIIALAIWVCDLNLLRTTCDIIGDLYDTFLVERTTPTISDEDHADSHHVEEPPTSKQKQDHVDEPPTSKQKPSTSTQKGSSHSSTQNKKRKLQTIMGVNLTSGAISKIVTGKCTSMDLKPVLQAIHIASHLTRSKEGKLLYQVALSDGSFFKNGYIPYDIFISNKLEKGSIVQLPKFQLASIFNSKGEIIRKSGIFVCDYNLLRTTCDVIGDPKLLPDNETPLVVRTTPTIPQEDHANSHHVEEPPTSIQNPSTSTQKCSSSSPTQNKKRKLQSSDDIISGFGKDISKLVSMIVEKTIEDGLGACYEKLGTLEEGVSKLMMEKSKEVDAGLKKLETLEEDVSKLTRMMMEKNKEDGMGACIEKLDKMGWGPEEPIYDTALLLFLKGADYRKLWLHLKPERCGKWVKIAGSMFGLLD